MSNLPIDHLPVIDLQQAANYAWAAGIVDGEGCINRNRFTSNGYRCSRLRINVTQASSNSEPPEMLTRFQNIFNGMGSISIQRTMTGQHKAIYLYCATNNHARQILRLIWPYLGTVKKEQAYKAGFKLNPSWE